MKTTFISGFLALTVIASSSVYSYGQGARQSVDEVLRNSDLVTIIGQADALNLRAQTTNPSASTRNVDDLDNFVVMAVPDSEPARTEYAEFDKNQKILHKATYGTPWIGVAPYTQDELQNLMGLQEGMDKLKPCLLKKKKPVKTPDEISGVVIYKTQNTNAIIYDYIFKNPATSQCHEYLYVPTTDYCFVGYPVACHLDINDPLNRNGKK
ncbi:MAG: hypothetical protein ACYCQI_10075 [Gammaproteobacteria bacterium]